MFMNEDTALVSLSDSPLKRFITYVMNLCFYSDNIFSVIQYNNQKNP